MHNGSVQASVAPFVQDSMSLSNSNKGEKLDETQKELHSPEQRGHLPVYKVDRKEVKLVHVHGSEQGQKVEMEEGTGSVVAINSEKTCMDQPLSASNLRN